MPNESLRDIARRYCVDDLPGASIPHARLQQILNCLHCGGQLTQRSLSFLQQQGLHMLHRLAIGDLSYDNFYELALTEQAIRIQAATDARLARETEERIREAAREEQRQLAYAQAEAVRLARESDPIYRAKIKNQQLRAQYGINIFVEPHHFSQLMSILKKVDAGRRLENKDVVWLSSVDEDYFTDELRKAYHRLEAEFFASEFNKTCDPWAAINASSHYRKCGRADDAHALLRLINIEQQSPKIQAALYTTQGGVMRDLKKWDEALHFGKRAHGLQPKDYRPCTLLGAIYIEDGQYNLGKAWYDKAIERGAAVGDVDRDIRSILFRLPQPQRRELEDFWFRVDQTRL